MNRLADYSHLTDVPACLKHYLAMVVKDKPDNVVKYLIDKIENEPWKKEEEEKKD